MFWESFLVDIFCDVSVGYNISVDRVLGCVDDF